MLLRRSGKALWLLVLGLVVTILVCLFSTSTALGQEGDGGARQYIVYDVRSESQHVEITGTGVTIEAAGDDWLQILATQGEVAILEAMGYRVEPLSSRSENGKVKAYLPLIVASGQVEINDTQQYVVRGVSDKFQRTDIARTGAAIDAMGADWVRDQRNPCRGCSD